MNADIPTTAPRRSRLGLYLPIAGLIVVIVAWSVFWFMARGTVNTAIGTWLAREAAEGRQWTCPDRDVSGYPFRFEMTCTNLAFSGVTPEGPVAGTLPRLAVVAQAYQPQHVIFEATGPLKLARTDGAIELTADWKGLDASVIAPGADLDRFSIMTEGPSLTIGGTAVAPLTLTAAGLEAHFRRDPDRPANERTYDFNMTVDGATVPPLDAFLGTSDIVNLGLDAKVSHVRPFMAASQAEELETWRQAGGTIDLLRFDVQKGNQRLRARGRLSLDDAHRPQGQIDASVAGLDQVLARLGIGGSSNLGALIAGGLAQLAPRQGNVGTDPSSAGLTTLPTVTIADGRIAVGPFAFGRVPPLY
jgi:hypothetical protein